MSTITISIQAQLEELHCGSRDTTFRIIFDISDWQDPAVFAAAINVELEERLMVDITTAGAITLTLAASATDTRDQ